MTGVLKTPLMSMGRGKTRTVEAQMVRVSITGDRRVRSVTARGGLDRASKTKRRLEVERRRRRMKSTREREGRRRRERRETKD